MSSTTWWLALAGVAAVGCSSQARAPNSPAETRPAAATSRAVPPSGNTTVAVDDAIANACKLTTPRFDFDSASVRDPARAALHAIATCLGSGPLAGRSVRLVGHTDPRGEVEYNFGLGQRRAGNVEQLLEQSGLPASRIATTSRGELDATGNDEGGWARDRRVDIVLAN